MNSHSNKITKRSELNATEEFLARGLRPGNEFQVPPIDKNLTFEPVKRVAIFAEAFLPKIDGVSKTAVLVTRHLQQSEREVIIFTPDNNGNTPEQLGPSQVVSVPSVEMPFAPETKVGFPSPIVNVHLDEFKPDLIHLFSPAVLSMAGIWYGQNRELPIVANYQTDLPGYTTQYGLNLFYQPVRTALRAIHNASHLTLAPAHTIIRQLQDWGFERLRLWARGVDTERFTPTKRSEEMRQQLLAGRPEGNLLVLYVGRLAAEKRIDLLTKVARLEGTALTIVGDGEARSDLEALFGERAHFTGYLFGEELAQAYASADLFTFTGTNETFGQVIMEAMASGLPTLVPNAGGVVDLVLDGMNGYICQDNPEDFRRKVELLRDAPEKRQMMSQFARIFAEQRPWTTVMEELEKYYGEACAINKEMLQAVQRERLRLRERINTSRQESDDLPRRRRARLERELDEEPSIYQDGC